MPQVLDFFGRPERVRTSDQLIKSQLLCQLSYRPVSEFFPGAPGRTRTCGLRVRSPALYPTELRAPNGEIDLAGNPNHVNKFISKNPLTYMPS